MFQSLVLSIICIIWGFILIIQARMEMKQSQNPKQKQKVEEKEDKFSGRTLYFSNVPLREMEECCLRKQNIFEEMNVIERVECKTAIYWIIRFIDKIFLEDVKGFFTEEGKKKLNTALNNILSMRPCFKKQQVQEDLTTVCKLIKYTLEKEDVSGIFYGHHILSDLNFWILDQPFPIEELKTWEPKPPKQKETRVFYGITKSWEYNYPRDLQKKIKNIVLPKEEEIFDIRAHFAQKYMELAQTFYTLEDWHIQQIIEYCGTMEQIFKEIISFQAADVVMEELNEMEQAIFDKNGAVTKGVLKYYNMITMELDRTMGFLPECKLKQDFDIIRQKVQNVYDNHANIEYQSYEEIFKAKRMIEEINRFILPKEIDWHDNYFYYGVTTTMRDIQQDPIIEVAGIETTMPAERDFFDRIIEGEYKTEITQNNTRENRARENRLRENRIKENRVRENKQKDNRIIEEMKFEEFEEIQQ
ncbi:hypothetical protein [Clostridium sp. MD294]|uniref:hypothetical protein n=1 Tax=Clostridium sp. MD294 TaxID=97138 RepID=UPI0002CB8690|nr:hypothetical protein [Clostridium sp. MD294]NDO45513.1 hypothetical protein [Clostridium sp. MD294]USF30835.1 hypothetical protein C820_002279 [Clostridium sp. MD294]